MATPDPMMHPVNAAGRFLLELVAAYGIGVGVWESTERIGFTGLVVLVALIAWGRFRVPDDPGPAPVPVAGWVRLLLEGAILVGGGVGLFVAHGPLFAGLYFLALVVHYATTPRRLRHVLSYRGR